MQIVKGLIVKATAGRDLDRFFVIASKDGNYAYIVDGKSRKLDNPKKKNIKHIAPTSEKVNLEDCKTDKAIRKLLHDYNNP